MLCVTAPTAIRNKPDIGLVPLFLVGVYVSGILVAYLFFNRKLKWRGQEIFEMAGMQVEETGDSFTARPRPAGKVPISKTEMIRFVDFITSNLIAFPITEENRVVFVLALPGINDLLGYNDLSRLLGGQWRGTPHQPPPPDRPQQSQTPLRAAPTRDQPQ